MLRGGTQEGRLDVSIKDSRNRKYRGKFRWGATRKSVLEKKESFQTDQDGGKKRRKKKVPQQGKGKTSAGSLASIWHAAKPRRRNAGRVS